MKLLFVTYGKTTDKHLEALIADYTARLGHYAPFEIVTLASPKTTRSTTPAEQKEAEADQLLRLVQPSDLVVFLDEHGTERRSTAFAQWLDARMATGAKRLVFVSGGPYGFSPRAYAVAREQVSLSQMTFSHQMVRLLFVEQLYRAFTILRHEPYHHE